MHNNAKKTPAGFRPIPLSLSQSLRLGVAAAAFLAWSPLPATAARSEPEGRPAFPSVQLPKKARGSEAVKHLGNRLGEVAAWYQWSDAKFSGILERDPHAWLDKEGRLLYADEFPPMPQDADTVTGTTTTASTAPFALADTFKLHSKPGATKIIYLDFNGHSVTGTAWNSGATINAPAFDFDGLPLSFSDAELERIQYIWQRVAEDYGLFDIDITTEEPLADALNRTSSTDSTYGSRVVITNSAINVCSSCGGIAYVGVFGYTSSTSPAYYQPAWVLYDKLGPANEKYVSEAISHEAGHNLGLSHDGTSTLGYYSGHGSGTTGWAPIMGVGYYQNLVQWSQGEYPGANNFEDDIAVIQTYGPRLVADDAGDSMATAAPIGGTAGSGTVAVGKSGVIGRRTDQDYFSFTAGAGTVQLSVVPDARSPNLDVSATLYAADGTLIATSNPVDTLDATINTSVPAGSYFLRLDGVGKGDLTTGYSDYGSVGHYRVSGSFVQSGFLAPVAKAAASPASGYAPLAVALSGDGSSDPDGTVVGYAWNFGDGSTGTGSNVSHTYTSPGTYTATLTVTDSQGLTNAATVLVTVNQDPSANTLVVSRVVVQRQITGNKSKCQASVTVKSLTGVAASGASVSGKWSGVVSSGTVTASTSTAGVAAFTSSQTTAKAGTCTFSVSSVSQTGKTYDPTKNVQTSGSFTW